MRARSVVIATGARYRRLDIANVDVFESSSVHYWASPVEVKLCANQEVALIGAGNSAGQAAAYLAGQGIKVWMLVRRGDLGTTMSRYLVDRVRSLDNVEVVTGAAISGLEGLTASWKPSAGGSAQPAKKSGGQLGTCSFLSAPSPTRIGCADRE